VTRLFIGTAAWTIPRECKRLFPSEGSHLERYARALNAVEINSSFYRPHQTKTYARWAACVPADFKFSVKLPKEITHRQRFVDVDAALDRFLEGVTSLGSKLGPILIQLPPSFAYDEPIAHDFFRRFRSRYAGPLVFEPRHATWFDTDVDTVLTAFRIARVAADPAPVPPAAETGGWRGIRYVRLHGSPRIYYSAYPEDYLADVAGQVRDPSVETWVIFDNTALGHATSDALKLRAMVEPS
jgi:uncharacterized protein YecE (DUF72 family)